MYLIPGLVILSILHDGEIDRFELLANFLEMIAKACVAGYIYVSWAGDHKGSPKCGVARQTPGKMARFERIEFCIFVDIDRFAPVKLVYFF